MGFMRMMTRSKSMDTSASGLMVHPGIASAVLGQANPAFTMRVHQHVTPGMTGVAAAALDEALSKRG
jgi:hypothetical protein